MEYFLSCDWGTSAFRIRLVDVQQEKVLLEEVSGEGILDTFNLWQQAADRGEQQRMYFYLGVAGRSIKKLEQKFHAPLDGVKIIISGMVTSSVGFMEVPYAEVPMPVDGSGMKTAFIAANPHFAHDCLLISGVKTADDIIRGEETQLIGCTGAGPVKNALFIFPGTHSKHIRVKDRQITGIKTYMTGEFFELLSKKSILKNSMETTALQDGEAISAFKRGVNDAIAGNLLHAAFTIRVNDLFGKFSKEQNFRYLSGLLIGEELKDLLAGDAETIYLISGPHLAPWYSIALDELGLKYIFSPALAADAVVKGQLKIGRQSKFIS